MKTRFSWSHPGHQLLCNQKQYINTVITGKDEEEILKAVKTMAKNGMAEGFIVLYSREKDPIISYLFDEGLLYVLVGKLSEMPIRLSMWTTTMSWPAGRLPSI